LIELNSKELKSIYLPFPACYLSSFFFLKEEKDTRPNISLIVADDLSYTDIGSYQGEIETQILD
jgi:hypothetical protein